jgi:cytochrome c553
VSTDAATPSLAGEDPQYLTQAIKAYRTTRKHALMSRLVADLSDQDIDNIVAFYTTQKSKPAEDGQNLLRDITDKCNRCHAGDINNPALAIPIINGQDKDYLTLALRAYRDGKRGNSMMHNMSMPYSDSIIESIASYYASRPAR